MASASDGWKATLQPPADIVGFGSQITEEEAAAFRRDGYLIKHDFFAPAEVEAMQAHIAQIDSSFLTNNSGTDRGDHLYCGEITSVSSLFRSLPYRPEVKAAISSLLGGPAAVNSSQYFMKPARTGLGTNWHQVRTLSSLLWSMLLLMRLAACARKQGQPLLPSRGQHGRRGDVDRNESLRC